MPKPKKESLFKPVIILCVICLATTGLLSLTYNFTAEARSIQDAASANADRQSVFPDAVSFDQVTPLDQTKFPGLKEVYVAKDADGKSIGWLVSAATRGYGGDVPVLTAFGSDGNIRRIKVLANDETPGLGKKVALDAFIRQFEGLDTGKDLSVKPKETDKTIIDAVSGATISSRAVTEAVNTAIRYIRQAIAEVS
jgi:Na+-translocating ferredoxin:NAD+ oxidoreductase subunit G